MGPHVYTQQVTCIVKTGSHQRRVSLATPMPSSIPTSAPNANGVTAPSWCRPLATNAHLSATLERLISVTFAQPHSCITWWKKRSTAHCVRWWMLNATRAQSDTLQLASHSQRTYSLCCSQRHIASDGSMHRSWSIPNGKACECDSG